MYNVAFRFLMLLACAALAFINFRDGDIATGWVFIAITLGWLYLLSRTVQKYL